MAYADMAADVIRYADEKNIEQFEVIGHSMGGKLAAQIAC
jgi:pimeloyl-ACP methyl ester carboxylesterase